MAKTQKQGVGVSFPSSPLLEKEQGKSLVVDLYIRVSTFSQLEGDSLEEQESELSKFCEYRGFKINRIYCEEAKSGGNTRRPEYQKLISDIENRRINAVVVKKLDRLSRSLLDFEQLMVLMQRHEVEFMSLRENFDTTTAMGKAMLRMALVFAQLEREQTSERVSDVMTYRATLGQFNGGTVAFGYISTNKTLDIVKAHKTIIELIFSLFLKTYSTSVVANHLNDAKIPTPMGIPWTESRVENILKNPLYKGCIRWKNGIYPGQHQPIIASSIWDTAQQIFESKRQQTNRSKTHMLLQKRAQCGICNTPLVPSFAYNRTKTKYSYYRCGSTLHGKHRREAFNCTFKQISTEKLHNRVFQAFHTLVSPLYLSNLEATITQRNTELKNELNRLSLHLTSLEDTLKKTKIKKNDYIDILVTKQFSSEDNKRIHERLTELEKEERHLQSQRTTHQLEYTNIEEQLLSTEAFKQDLLHLFTLSPHENPTDYRTHLHAILDSLSVTPDTLIFTFKSLSLPLTIQDNTS